MSTGNVIGGYKAATKNPNVSDEAKEHAAQKVKELENSEERQKELNQPQGGNPGNIIGGYKATLARDDRSDEAKQHAREVLEQEGEA